MIAFGSQVSKGEWDWRRRNDIHALAVRQDAPYGFALQPERLSHYRGTGMSSWRIFR